MGVAHEHSEHVEVDDSSRGRELLAHRTANNNFMGSAREVEGIQPLRHETPRVAVPFNRP